MKTMTLEASRAPFGRGLGSSWALFGRSWALLAPLGRFLGASWTLLGVSLAPLGPLERILDPQGSIWGPLWALKTRFGVDFGRVWGESGEDLDNWDPRAASLRLAKRLNARGSQPPSVLDIKPIGLHLGWASPHLEEGTRRASIF